MNADVLLLAAKDDDCWPSDVATKRMIEVLVANNYPHHVEYHMQKHIFLRKETLATGGSMCDCTYISKEIATREELQAFEDDMGNEAKRGGIVL